MRSKLITFVILLWSFSLVSFFLWLKAAESEPRDHRQDYQSIIRDQDQGLMPADKLAPLVAVRARAESDEFINGVVIDGNADTVSNSDIRYQVVAISPQQDCLQLADDAFERAAGTSQLRSDQQGRFTIPLATAAVAEPENYCLVINASKATFASTTVASPLDTAILPGLIDIELHRNIALAGTVEDPNGQAISGASIALWASNPEFAVDGIHHCISDAAGPTSTTVTAADGRFILDTINETNFCVQAFHENWVSSPPLVFTDQDIGQSLQLQLRQNIAVTGKVLDPQGYPVAGIAIRFNGLLLGEQSKSYMATSDVQGDFTIAGLDYDQYQLHMVDPAYNIAEPTVFSYQTELSENDLIVTVFPLTTITGTVINDSGQGVGGVMISARSPYALEQTMSTANSNASGEFQLVSLHRSNSAYDSAKLATAFVEGTEPDSIYVSTDSVCIDFIHPQYQTRTMTLSATDSALDLGNVFLDASIIQLSGVVVDSQNKPIEAKLIFENTITIESDPDSWEARLPDCDDSKLEIAVNTDQYGNFAVSIDKPSVFNIQVITDRYKPRQRQLDVTGSKNDVVIKIK